MQVKSLFVVQVNPSFSCYEALNILCKLSVFCSLTSDYYEHVLLLYMIKLISFSQ